jgi:hypothetical protein
MGQHGVLSDNCCLESFPAKLELFTCASTIGFAETITGYVDDFRIFSCDGMAGLCHGCTSPGAHSKPPAHSSNPGDGCFFAVSDEPLCFEQLVCASISASHTMLMARLLCAVAAASGVL